MSALLSRIVEIIKHPVSSLYLYSQFSGSSASLLVSKLMLSTVLFPAGITATQFAARPKPVKASICLFMDTLKPQSFQLPGSIAPINALGFRVAAAILIWCVCISAGHLSPSAWITLPRPKSS